MASKLPSFQFYPGDWMKEPSLRRCSHAAKGVYIDMLCLMFECDERGVLATAGRAWTDDEIAQAVGGDKDVTLACIVELVEKTVVSRNQSGAIYCRRMVRDEHKRMLCADAGRRGGNPTLKGQSKGQPTPPLKGQSKGQPTPSSSSSSSSSDPPLPPPGGGSNHDEVMESEVNRLVAMLPNVANVGPAQQRKIAGMIAEIGFDATKTLIQESSDRGKSHPIEYALEVMRGRRTSAEIETEELSRKVARVMALVEDDPR